MKTDAMLTLPIEIQEDALIKVMGVGGGGCNAVNYLYSQGIEGVSFLVCNTDRQSLQSSSVPAKLQLGPGRGAGGNPDTARTYAEESREAIKDALDDGTKMLFLTAGQGGGTGTGASPIVAEVARELDILTVAIVTIPFAFEGQPKILKAMRGIARLAEQVDALLVLNNEKLRTIYPSLNIKTGFAKSDDVVANAARAIAEIITIPSDIINTDFQDVYNTLKDGKVAIMNVGRASGENRITRAIQDALNSPLIKTSDVSGAKRVLLQLYCSDEHAILMEEFSQVHEFVARMGSGVEVQWGVSTDNSLGEDVRITIVATGYEVNDIPTLSGVEEDEAVLNEAIRSNYESNPEPAAESDPEPDPETVANEPIDSETIEIDLTASATEQTTSTSTSEVTIEVEEDASETVESERPTRKWFRNW